MYTVNFIVVIEMSASNFKFNKLHCKDPKTSKDETYEKTNDISTEKHSSTAAESAAKKCPTTSTPVRIRETVEDDTLSPVFMRFTQDNVDEDVDVVWDWDSPHSGRNKFFGKKKIQQCSPKIPRKQILFEASRPKFNALKAQLEHIVSQVTEETKTEVNDDCLIISSDSIFLKPKVPETSERDLFDDDSFDEELIKCSQRIEENYVSDWCTSLVNNNNKLLNNTIEDDSFDVFLEEINETELLSQPSGSENCSQTYSQASKSVASPRAISRTNSVPVNFLSTKQNTRVKENITFVRTKSVELSVQNDSTTIPFSQEDIEKKRLEAMALLEKKRKQNEIEKKRQEALERLNRNRLQRKKNNKVSAIKR